VVCLLNEGMQIQFCIVSLCCDKKVQFYFIPIDLEDKDSFTNVFLVDAKGSKDEQEFEM